IGPDDLESLVTVTGQIQSVNAKTWKTIVKELASAQGDGLRFIDLRLQGQFLRHRSMPPEIDSYLQPNESARHGEAANRLGNSIPYIHEPSPSPSHIAFAEGGIDGPSITRELRNSISNRSIYGHGVTPRASGTAI